MLVGKKSLKKASVLGEKSLFQLRILERFSTTSYLVVRGERVKLYYWSPIHNIFAFQPSIFNNKILPK